MNVIVPLGGLGTRFQNEGFLSRPKPFVPVLAKPMIMWVLDNLSLQEDDTLVVVFNPSFMGLGRFMREVVGDTFPKCQFVELPGPTRGAAETVLFGLEALPEAQRRRPTILVDGDTFYTTDVIGRFRDVCATHNALFCFPDTQPKPIYSYVKVDGEGVVREIKEKIKISDLANSGVYCFRSGADLARECAEAVGGPAGQGAQLNQDGVLELYTSGVIARMLAKGEPFKALQIEAKDMHVLGTPEQVQKFCAEWPDQRRRKFVFDFEGVLVNSRAEPIARNIAVAQRLRAEGHRVVVHSTRPWGSERQTWADLEKLGIECDELALGKPRADFYVGGAGTVDSLLADLDKQIGCYPTDVKAVFVPAKRQCSSRPKRRIGALWPDSSDFDVSVRVVGMPRDVSADQSRVRAGRCWEVPCGDKTGKVTLLLTNAEAKSLSPGQVVTVFGGSSPIVNRYMRLVVDCGGRLLHDPQGVTIETIGDTDLSAIEHELVDA